MMSENNIKQIGTSCVIATEQDIYDIENPYEGLFVYVRDTRKVYVVTQVEAYAINGSHAGYKVVAYNQIQGALLNYRGEYVAANTPKAPVEGDWYRNITYGRTYIMQDGAWRFMTQDGANGIAGDKGDKGETGDKGHKGEKGDPGEDAPYQEFIYLLTDWKAGEKDVSQIRMPEYTNEEYQHDDFINLLSENKRHGWTDSPRGVSSNMLTEWVSHRRKASTNGMPQWGELSSPVPWSVWGVNGTDGDGITYIFCKSAKEPNEFLKTDWGTILVFSDDEISSGKHTHIDGIPESAKEAGWTDNPENTDAANRFIYVAIRRRITNADGIAEWQTYFTTPTLWASYGQKGDPGPGATFDFYELLPSASTITATFDQATSRITKISPTSLRADLKKITQSESQITNTLADAELIVSAYTYEESVSDDKIYNLSTAVPSIDLLEWWGYEIPAYVEMQLKLNGTVFDTKRIPVQYSFTGVSATMPDWVDEWNDPNSKAQFNGQNVLAVRAYIGDQPKPSELWSGVLIGSNIANVDGLHWDEDPMNTYDFSGILAVKNFDPSVGDNIIGENDAEVSFALDAKTGDAYFNGIVYATDGKFTGEIEATSGKFENGVITNSTVSNLTVSNSSDDYNVIIGGDQAGDRAFTINGVNVHERFQSAVVTASAPFVQEGDLLDSSADLVLPDSTLDRVELDFTNKTADIYNAIANAIARDPYFVVKTTEEHPIQGMVTVYYPAEVSQNGSSYDVGFNRKSMSLAPIVEINCDTQGKTGSISVTSYEAVDGIYSRTTMNGGSFAVEYNESDSFGDSTSISSVSIVDNGIKILGIPTCATTNTHNYDKGVLYVDENGVVRVSNGEGSYIKATV